MTTWRLVWTQGVGRLRWLSAKLVAVVGITLVFAAAYTVLITWWLAPLNRSTGDRFQPGIFDQQGVVPIVYALFALALGIAAGTVLGRTMQAMAATLVGFVGLRLVVAGILLRGLGLQPEDVRRRTQRRPTVRGRRNLPPPRQRRRSVCSSAVYAHTAS